MAQNTGFGGLARLDPAASAVTGSRNGVQIDLTLSQGVPYRVFTLDAPPRLVVDFREVDWVGTLGPKLLKTDNVSALRVGGFRPGWSRMVADLAGPFALEGADMRVDTVTGTAKLVFTLTRTTPEIFEASSGLPASPGWDLPTAAEAGTARPPRDPSAPLLVVLDPGHGGIDPGAKEGEVSEKDLMLSFARQLKEVLLRTGEFEVVLTRDADLFVSLERRVAIAHQEGADVFLSLHADSLGEGTAHGATVYALSHDASDAASAALAERHNRADMLAGLDLSGTDDVVADILMDLARMETQPRAELLARALLLGIGDMGLPLNSRPSRKASFSVLKSPDIPSILLELGFLSSGSDLDNLVNPEWRDDMATAIANGIKAWMLADAANAQLVRQ
ncbi:N-acetylmuramoyl-L-alanine amidase [Rhodobacteraceae bacterium KMM 6894]|nr:N-acetylmuramoyl-L-alanine amidase [Rhodobacteraceae bacterium KMM 6894]